jgi:hypothetical protein
VPAQINPRPQLAVIVHFPVIRGLREYRATAPLPAMLAQMRSGLWKQIYEKWPDYPRNLYLERTFARAIDRAGLQMQAARRLFEAGIYYATGGVKPRTSASPVAHRPWEDRVSASSTGLAGGNVRIHCILTAEP